MKIIFFTTSCPSTLKVRGDIERITQILNAKRIPYEEVRHTKIQASPRHLPILHAIVEYRGVSSVTCTPALLQPSYVLVTMLAQIDLNMYPERRRELLLFNDGVTALPQLRVNGVYVGDGETVQELEDFGELDDVLEVCCVVHSLAPCSMATHHVM